MQRRYSSWRNIFTYLCGIFLLLQLSNIIQEVEASHFSFGTITYEAPPDTNQVVYTMVFAYTYNYGYWYNNRPVVGRPTWVDGTFYNARSQEISLSVVAEKVYPNQNWWYGYATYAENKPSNGVYRVNYDLCCRIYRLHDGNSGDRTNIDLELDLGKRWRSPMTIAMPRVVVDHQRPISFKVASISHDNYQLVHSVTSTTRSKLYLARPCGSYNRAFRYTNDNWTRFTFGSTQQQIYAAECQGVVRFSLSPNGVGTWTPADLGNFAISLTISDGAASIVSDFLFVVETYCAPSDTRCNHAPYFNPPLPSSIDVYAGVAFSQTFYGVDDDNDYMELLSMSTQSVEGFSTQEISEPGLTTINVNWFPQIDHLSYSTCYQLVDAHGKSSRTECVLYNLKQSNYILVSGTIRDFNRGEYTFGTFSSPSSEISTPLYVEDTLVSSTLKPVYKSATGTYVPSSTDFNAWWSDEAARGTYLYTIVLVQFTNLHPSQRVFSLFNTEFYPIDDVATAIIENSHNRYFTYEIHTYFEYLGGETYSFQARDDLLVFINNKIVPNWTLQGLHASNLVHSVAVDNLRTSHGLTVGENYQMDLFWVQRSRDSTPVFGLEMSNATNCNAINLLSRDQSLVSQSMIFDYADFRSAQASSFVSSGTAKLDSNNGYLSVINTDEVSASGSIYYADNNIAQKIKILNGFKSTFTFNMQSKATGSPQEGFAFVIQDHEPTARGNEGGGLGYASISRSIAIEFDTNPNSAQRDPAFQHISLHTKYSGVNSALEDSQYYPSGSSIVGNIANLPFRFNNGTDHRIRIEMNPGLISYSLRVYINDNIRPIYVAELDAKLLTATFINGAYVGFTSSSSASNSGYVRIKNWTMLVVPALASETGPVSIPTTAVAGIPTYMDVQLRDACKNNLYVSGEAYKFTATLKYKFANNVDSPVTIEDRGLGIYRFTFKPQRSGTWNLLITYDGAGKYISNRFSGYDIEILPSFTSTEHSYFTHGSLPIARTNIRFPTFANPSVTNVIGLGCQVFTANGELGSINGYPSGIILETKAQYDQWIAKVQDTQFVACALHTQMNDVTSRNDVYKSVVSSATVSTDRSVSMAFILEKVSGTLHTRDSAYSVDDIVSISYVHTTTGAEFQANSGGFNRTPHGYVQGIPQIFSVGAGTTGAFTIVSKDIYDNYKFTNEEGSYTYSFSPSLGAGLPADITVNSGYFLCSFGTGSSGIYTLSVLYDGVPVRTTKPLYVNAGPASHITSIATGAGVGGTAGSTITYKVQLRDSGNNNVITQNPVASEITSLTYFSDKHNFTVNNIGSMWDAATTVYDITYSTTVAGVYNIEMMINGKRHVGTSTTSVAIAPGVETAKSFAYSDNAFNPPLTTTKAGESYVFYIQARDTYENFRTTSNNNQGFTVTSNYPTSVTTEYVANGIYSVTLYPQSVGTYNFEVKYGTETIQFKNNDPATWSLTVLPGDVSAKSTFKLTTKSMEAKDDNSANFEFEPFDAYINPVSGLTVAQLNGVVEFVAVASSSSYYYTERGTITSCDGTKCVGSFKNVHKAAVYSITAVLSSTQESLVIKTEDVTTLTVTPGATDYTKCLVNGVSAAYIVNTNIVGTIIDHDKFSNIRNHVSNTQFTCKFGSTQANSEPVSGSKGYYTCTLPTGSSIQRVSVEYLHQSNVITTFGVSIESSGTHVYAKVYSNNTLVDPSASGTSVATFTAGVSGAITVRLFTDETYSALDTTARTLSLEGYSNSVSVSTLSSTSSTGIFTFPISSTIANDKIGFIIRGAQVANVHGTGSSYNYYTYAIKPSKMSPVRSLISMPTSTIAGKSFEYTIAPRDEYSNIIKTAQTVNIASTITRQTSTLAPVVRATCTWSTDVYKCSFGSAVTVAGRYLLDATLSGADAIAGRFTSTHFVTVVHADIDPSKTRISYSSTSADVFAFSSAPVAGVDFVIYGFAYDTYDNPCTTTTSTSITGLELRSSNIATNATFATRVSGNVFSTTVKFVNPTYYGSVVQLTNPSGTVFKFFTLGVRSGPVGTGSYIALSPTATSGISTTSEDPQSFTVDEDYLLYLHVKDVNGLPWINSLSSLTADIGLISVNIRAEPIARTSSTIAPEISNALQPGEGPVRRRYDGVFVLKVDKSYYNLIGNYNINKIIVDSVDLKPTEAVHTFVKITAGIPHADNTLLVNVTQDVIKTNLDQSLLFFLRDAGGNIYTEDDANVTVRITRGSMSCEDHVGSDEMKWDDYVEANFQLYGGSNKMSVVPGQTYTYYAETIVDGKPEFEEKTVVVNAYKLDFKPLEAGVFTLNITTSAGNYMSCAVAQTQQITVVPGLPDPSTSMYWFTNNAQLGVAGTPYTVRVQLKDAFNQNLTTSSGILVGLGKDGTTGQDTIHNNWIIDCSDQNTCTNAKVTNYIDYSLYGYKNGQIDFTFVPMKAGVNRDLFISLSGSGLSYARISPNGPSTFTVIHGPPKSITRVTNSLVSLSVGEVGYYEVAVVDEFNNPVTTTTTHKVVAELIRTKSVYPTDKIPVTIPTYRFTMPSNTHVNGSVSFTFNPAWEGEYDILVTLSSSANGEVYASQRYETAVHIQPQTCHAQWIANGSIGEPVSYRCPDGTCATNYATCKTPACDKKYICSNGTSDPVCTDDISQCPCADNTFTRKGGVCIKSTVLPSVTTCPVNTSPCNSNPLQCRRTSDHDSCPTVGVCPNGYVICSDGITCATETAKCPTTVTTGVCDQFKCPTGECVPTSDSCPTPITCPKDKVLCLTDGSCQDSIDKCPSPVKCLVDDWVLCPLSNECRPDYASCPSRKTCPVGWVLCEDGSCSSDVTKCGAPLTCPLNQVRCGDGTCAESSLLCPTRVSCPASEPVLCSDGTCTTDLAKCNIPSVCPSGSTTCPDGSCVLGTKCPVSISCPLDAPILCPDKQCVSDVAQCSLSVTCPPALPLKCPNGSCRASISDCPSTYVCPDATPIRCADHSCAIAHELCPSTSNNACPAGKIRCPGGECATSSLSCPSHVTCPLGTSKCYDGRCSASCTEPINTCLSNGLYQCPVATSGITCTSDLNNCPLSVACPTNRPVKCLDASCASSIAQCPPAPVDEPPASRIPCPDGSWTLSTCATAVTCPESTPYKCYDQTCRATPADCPVAQQCSSLTPYRCSNGNCVSRPWECTSPVEGVCDSTSSKPVKCPLVNGISLCVAKISDCPVPDSNTLTYCPSGYTRCRDGSCKETSSACAEMTCPSAFPFLCENGACVASSNDCPTRNGCPRSTPVKCPGVGSCVAALVDCPAANCPDGLSACSDGSCSQFCSNRKANGCPNQFERCFDGTCVSDYSICTSKDNMANSCPGSHPIRCSNGYCSKTSSECPALDNSYCPADKPVACADGTCKLSADLCKLILPCDTPGFVRCPDGTCMDASEDPNVCPTLNTCPTINGEQWVRCPADGLCAPSLAQCLGSNGCPMKDFREQFRCDNGRCVDDQSKCNTNVRNSDGCMGTEKKCWDGSCSTTCPATNGCPTNASYLCPNGQCKANRDECSGETSCPTGQQRCADGRCSDKCHTLFNCPIETPYRCADGSCKRYSAEFRHPKFGLTSEEIKQLTCSPTVQCPSSAYIMCESGQCVTDKSECNVVDYTCDATQTRCLFNSNGGQNAFYSTCVTDPSQCSTPSCPSALPIMCPNGACVSDIINCDVSTDPTKTLKTGSASKVVISGTHLVLCFDGSYRHAYAECVDWSTKNRATDCAGMVCSDGTCIPTTDPRDCPVIPSCPINTYRCLDGSCRTSCESVIAPTCKPEEDLGVDGICYPMNKTPAYDGCSPTIGYLCTSRDCAVDANSCDIAANPDPDRLALIQLEEQKRREARSNNMLLTSHVIFKDMMLPVTKNNMYKIKSLTNNTFKSCTGSTCVGSMKINSTSFVYNPTEKLQERLVSPLAANFRVVAYSGMEVDVTQGSTIYVEGVSESQLMNATNKITYSRISEFGPAFTLSQSLLSPAFSCRVDKGIKEPFNVPLQLVSNIDRVNNPRNEDICLAKLHRYEKQNYYVWSCVYTEEQRKSGGIYNIVSDPTLLNAEVFSNIYRCSDEELSTETTSVPAIYAFIHSPISSRQAYVVDTDTWWRDNVIWVLLVICGGIVLLAFLTFVVQRLNRYGKKLKDIREEVVNMEREVEDIEELGGNAGTKDEEVVLQNNPLAIQLSDLRKYHDTDHTEKERRRLEEQQLASTERREIIQQLHDENQRGLEHLQTISEQLNSGPSGPSTVSTGPQPVHPRAVTQPIVPIQQQPSSPVSSGSNNTAPADAPLPPTPVAPTTNGPTVPVSAPLPPGPMAPTTNGPAVPTSAPLPPGPQASPSTSPKDNEASSQPQPPGPARRRKM